MSELSANMTRSEFVSELIKIWQESAEVMQKDGYDTAALEVKTALRVLKQTYAVNELSA
jgi:hypothetical protein